MDQKGVIRVGGRIDESPETRYETKKPAILPPDDFVTLLIVSYFHQKNFHQGQEATIWRIRQKFWIINLRSVVKKVARDCNVCKLRRAKPSAQLMGNLPKVRLMAREKIFSYVGIDCFGPLFVTVGRSRQKRYGLICVCMVTRAIHLELLEDMSSGSFIRGLRNFMLRRGAVKEIYSDNGTNFKGAEIELKQAASAIEYELGTIAAEYGIEWHFNPPGSPHFGGIWERLIQIVKKCLYDCLKEESPRLETLRSALIEAEYVVNSRPLTHNPVEHIDEEPLTPNNLLHYSRQNVRIPASFDSCKDEIKIQWKICQRISNNFWWRWSKECLPLLTRRSKWFEKKPNIEIGDLVFIIEPNAERCNWKKGIVTRAYPGRDNLVRVAAVRTSHNREYVRPITKLAKIDIK